MKRGFGIRVAPCRFRQDNRDYIIDHGENAISDALTSIKHVSARSAQALYEMREELYPTFTDLLADMEFKPALDYQVVGILICLGYFREFGSTGKLLQVHHAFRAGEYRFSKAHIAATQQKRLAALRTYEASLPESELPIAEQIRRECEYIGTPLTTRESERNLYAVLEVDARYSPKLRLYSIATGNIGLMKIKKALFQRQPLASGDTLRILDWQRRPAYQYVGGKSCPRSGLFELWLKAYERLE